jgi:hypothetical protein
MHMEASPATLNDSVAPGACFDVVAGNPGVIQLVPDIVTDTFKAIMTSRLACRADMLEAGGTLHYFFFVLRQLVNERAVWSGTVSKYLWVTVNETCYGRLCDALKIRWLENNTSNLQRDWCCAFSLTGNTDDGEVSGIHKRRQI